MNIRRLKFVTILFVAATFSFLGFYSAAFADEFYVKKTGSDSNDGLTWKTAFATISKAVKDAHDGDEIWVAAGTYVENLDISKTISLFGGYPANGGYAQNYSKNVTIIDGGGKGAVITANNVEITLDGFTITNGKTNNAGAGAGYRYLGYMGDTKTGKISNCIFSKNIANSNGGGIFRAESVTDCTFTGNKAEGSIGGGGIYEAKNVTNCTFTENSGGGLGSSPTVINCTFTGNTGAGGLGGATTVENCTFTQNQANNKGGGINNAKNVTDCTFTGNKAYNGGGINEVTTVTGCTFTENHAYDGGAIYNVETLTNCTFEENQADWDGGAIYKSKNVKACPFTGNLAEQNGGAVYDAENAEDCTFNGNQATNGNGGAILNFQTVTNCAFVENAAVFGGALYHVLKTGDSALTTKITGCTFDANDADRNGGGIYLSSRNNETVEIVNSTFTANTAFVKGGGIYLDGDYGRKEIINCTFIDNDSPDGSEVHNRSDTVDEITNCIFWNTNRDGFCFVDDNTNTLRLGNCAFDVNENLLIYDNADPEIFTKKYDLITISDPDFSASHSKETVVVKGVEHTVFKLKATDTSLIHGGTGNNVNVTNDQLGVKRNSSNPSIGAIEYTTSNQDSDDEYSGSNPDNNSDSTDSDESQENTNNNSRSSGGGGGCNSGMLIYGIILIMLLPSLKSKVN